MEISNNNNLPAVQKRGNFFKRHYDAVVTKVNTAQEMFNEAVTEELLEQLLPKMKKLTPLAQKELKKYMNSGERVIVIKMVGDDIQIMIMKQEHIDLQLKEGSTPEQAVEKMESLDECIELFLSNSLDNVIRDKQ